MRSYTKQEEAEIYLRRGDEEIPVIVEAYVTAGHPAKIDGPPERCYPSEPDECELVSAIDESGKDWLSTFSSIELEEAREKIFEKAF